MIHYHGTPLTPRSALYTLAGKHFCVSYAHPGDAQVCQQIGQSVLWDNGAFSLHTQGKAVDWTAFYRWVEPKLGHPHWAVVPDVIDGAEEDNLRLANEWPHRKDCAAPVWHMAESLDQMGRLLDLGFTRLCFGSSGAYWSIGTDAWQRRCDQAFDWLAQRGDIPWVHMLRGLALGGKRWPFASADSVNVARNFSSAKVDPEFMAREIDAVQTPCQWRAVEQMQMFPAA